jgi:hypothetical protein
MYPYELEVKDSMESYKSVSYLDILLDIDSNGRLKIHCMTIVMILTLQSSTFLFYVNVVIYDFHLL